jgi:MFS family permease
MATMACAFVKNYAGLLVARSACGAGEAGFTTLAQPFLAEHYPQEKRATVLSVFGLALPVGAALGYLLGGILGARFGWRAAFIWVGLPALVLGVIALSALKEPLEQVRPTKPGLREYGQLFKNKPFVWICLAHAMVTFVMGGLSAWMPTYFTRYYAMDVGQAGTVFGVLVIVSGAAGTYVGGKWADRLLVREQDAYYRVMRTGLAGAFLFALGGIFIPCLPAAVLSVGFAVACLFMPLGPIAAALVKVTQQAVRPMAFAANIFLIHILGDALSPVLIGQAADWWGLKTAVVLSVVIAVPAGVWCVRQACRNELPNE